MIEHRDEIIAEQEQIENQQNLGLGNRQVLAKLCSEEELGV